MRRFARDYIHARKVSPAVFTRHDTTIQITQTNHGLSVGMPIRYNTVTDLWTAAQSDDISNTARWVVTNNPTRHTFTAALLGRDPGIHSLLNGSDYYTSWDTAGGIEDAPPYPPDDNAEVSNLVFRTQDPANRIISVEQPYTITDHFMINGYMATGENTTLYLMTYSPADIDIIYLYGKTTSGNIDMRLLTSTVTSTSQTMNSTLSGFQPVNSGDSSDITVSTGDYLTLELLNNSSSQGVSWCMWGMKR